MSPSPLTVAIVNDFEVVVRGLHAMLQPFHDRVEVVELNAQSEITQPVDVALYDTFSEPQVDGVEFDAVLRNPRAAHVAVYTWNVHPDLVEVALAKGCRGYLDKALTAEELVDALEQIAAGQLVVRRLSDPDDPTVTVTNDSWPGQDRGLTPRESEIVTLITQGMTNQDIAARTYLSINSVKSYIRTAYRKMDVKRRSQAVLWGIEHGMLPDVSRDRRPNVPGTTEPAGHVDD